MWRAMPRRPGGVRQQFKAVLPMVESMLDGLKQWVPRMLYIAADLHTAAAGLVPHARPRLTPA